MAIHPVKMPKLGMTMREGRVVGWPVAVGEHVEKGELLLVIESEKAEVEIEAQETGFLRHVYVESGNTVPCGSLLALLSDDADEVFDTEAMRALHDTPQAAATSATPSGTRRFAAQTVGVAGAASLGGAAGVAPVSLQQSGSTAPSNTRRAVAPAARSRAKELGIEIDAVRGSGPGGRVVRADVEACAAARATLVPVAEGVALEVPATGHGDELLLLPGFGTDISSFAALVGPLSAAYRVRAMNPRGIGASDAGGDAPVSPRTVAGDAAALLESAAHVVGASFGAAAAVELALAKPGLVRSLVLVTPSLRPSPRLLAVLDAWTKIVAETTADTAAATMLPWLFSSRTLADAAVCERLSRGFSAMTSQISPATLRRYADGLRGWSESRPPNLSRIECPVLVIEADEDLLTPDAADAARAISGARLVTLPATGHAAAVDSPRELIEELRAFLLSV